ncbi:MAG: hypothetical protein ABJD68_03985 [Nakamurella sp.]
MIAPVPAVRGVAVPGVAQVELPIGVNSIGSVNMYILADGDQVTVVDCGGWQPGLPDGGLAVMEAGLEGRVTPCRTSPE